MKFLGMRHIAIVVSDLKRSAKFYMDAFGMIPFGPVKNEGRTMPLVSPRMRDQITLVTKEEEGEAGHNLNEPGVHGGIDHFGFFVSAGTNLDRLRTKIEKAGGTFVGRADIAKWVPSLFFRDPDGYLFQITRFPRLTRLYVTYLNLAAMFGRR